tara:strand:+ start:242 stop:412 length:171 start_codon:yes stop_codon:yes gene_type:complete
MDDRMTKLEKENADLKEQNKLLLQSLERHLEEKQDLRKQLYKDNNNEFPPKYLDKG